MNDPAPVAPLRRRGLPMLLAALAFASGVVMARHWHGPAMLVTSTTLMLALVVASLSRAPRAAWVAVLGLWVAVGCWCATMQAPPLHQTALIGYADGLSRSVEGRVLAVRPLPPERPHDSPAAQMRAWQTEPGGWEQEADGEEVESLDLAVTTVEEVTPDASVQRPVTGGLRLTLAGASPPLRCGDRVVVPLRLRVPEVYRDPGAFSYADLLEEQEIGALGTAKAGKLRILEPGPGDLRCRFSEWQHWAVDRLRTLPNSPAVKGVPEVARLSPADASMLAAMLFGDKAALSTEQRAGFERTGTFHLFVVSGLHVALVTGLLFLFFRRARVPEPLAVGLTLGFAFAYALLTGFGVPAQRALAMSAIFLVARALDRDRNGLNALGSAALLILVADPRALFTASFQMTALVILAVGGIAVPVAQRLLSRWQMVVHEPATVEMDAWMHPVVAGRRVALRLWSGLLQELLGAWAERLPELAVRAGLHLASAFLFSAAIELCMALPMAVYFHRAAPLALPANLLVAPLAAILAGVALLTFVLGLVSGWLAALPAMAAAVLLHAMQFTVNAIGHARLGDLRVPGPPALAAIGCGLLLGASLLLLRMRRGWCAALGFALALGMPLLVLWPSQPRLHPNVVEVTAIDVGQGDSIFVASPQGRTMLVDAGGPVGRLTTKWDVGEEVVAPFLWSRGIRRLDTVVITHGHSDHIGGMPAVLRDFRPRELWLSLQPGQSAAMRSLLAEAAGLGIEIHWLAAGDQLPWGATEVQILSPERGYANYGAARNDDSLVMQMNYGRASVLLEGDAEAPSEEAMLAHGRLRPVTLLKVGHHGSLTSTTPGFLSAVAPQTALVSVGRGNTFGHPRWTVLERLEAAHVRTFRTDRMGAESVLLSADGHFTTEQIGVPEAYN